MHLEVIKCVPFLHAQDGCGLTAQIQVRKGGFPGPRVAGRVA